MIVEFSKLVEAFAKRRCAICGEQAKVFSPRDDGPDQNLCFRHAMGIGWPWESEAEPAPASVAL